MPQNAASDQGLHCWVTGFLWKKKTVEVKIVTETFKITNELNQMIRMDKSTGQKRVVPQSTDTQSLARDTPIDARSGNILSFLLPLFQEWQLSVTGESMCTKYWLTA